MMIVRDTIGRLKQSTPTEINREVRREIDDSVREHTLAGDIDRRLEELDEEWDIERTLITNAAALGLVGVGLSLLDRRWLILSGVVGAFLLQHGLQGWCPPLPLFRAAGVRTRDEIEEERYALRAVRGDFDPMARTVGPAARAAMAIHGVRRQVSPGRREA